MNSFNNSGTISNVQNVQGSSDVTITTVNPILNFTTKAEESLAKIETIKDQLDDEARSAIKKITYDVANIRSEMFSEKPDAGVIGTLLNHSKDVIDHLMAMGIAEIIKPYIIPLVSLIVSAISVNSQ